MMILFATITIAIITITAIHGHRHPHPHLVTVRTPRLSTGVSVVLGASLVRINVLNCRKGVNSQH